MCIRFRIIGIFHCNDDDNDDARKIYVGMWKNTRYVLPWYPSYKLFTNTYTTNTFNLLSETGAPVNK